jgi:protein O-GlcNAc transferase
MKPIVEPDEAISLEVEVRESHRLLLGGDPEAALNILSPMIAERPDCLSARFLLALVAWKLDRLDWAVELMRTCHEAWPMDGAVAEILASLYAQAGNLQESLFMGKLATGLKPRRALLELAPPGFPSFGFAFQHIRENPKLAEAQASLAGGKLSDAIEKARQHVVFNPQNIDTRGYYASLLLRAGKASAAVDALRDIEPLMDSSSDAASLYARALTCVGEFKQARLWHEKALTLAPDNSEIMAARIADGIWLDADPVALTGRIAGWTKRFCAALPTRQWRQPGGKLVIGYLVANLSDTLDAAAIAAVARAHDRDRVTVIGYGIGAQSWNENLPFQGAFDTWQDIGTLDPATLVRFFERDSLHVMVDTCGFALPRGLQALARLSSAIRVAWLIDPAQAPQRVYDAAVGPTAAQTARSKTWAIPSGYPFPRAANVVLPRDRHATICFGADIRMPQLNAEIVALWSSLLTEQPTAQLLLRAHDMGPGSNIDRLVTRFGRDLSARIDVVDGETNEEFYARVDVALLPRHGNSPRVAADALACHVPAVALAGNGWNEPYDVFLRDLGLAGLLVAADAQEYRKIALSLTASTKAREQAAGAIAACVPSDDESAKRFAHSLENHAHQALSFASDIAS